MLTSSIATLPWWVVYRLPLALTLFAMLLAVLAAIFLVDRRYSKDVIDKFLLENQLDTTKPHTVKFPAKFFTVMRALFLGGMLAVLIVLIETYQYYENQYLVQFFAFLLFCINVTGSYLLGSLKRNRGIEALINKLHVQIQQHDAATEELLITKLRQQAQSQALARLVQLDTHEKIAETYMRRFVEEAANTMRVPRVSIWRFSEDGQSMYCEMQYNASGTVQFTQGAVIQAKDFPSYFTAVTQSRVLSIDHAAEHPVTQELKLSYLDEYQIGALLDAVIWLDEKPIGVLCHEHVGGMREWTIDEQNFAGSLVDVLRIHYEAERRNLVESDLAYQQKHLETIVKARTATIESNAKLFRFLVERAPVKILYMNVLGEIIEMNPEAERISGYSREYAIGKTYFDLFAKEDDREARKAIFKRVVMGEKIQGQVVTSYCADGHTIDLSISLSMELDADGNPIIISIGQDVSQQKALEESLIRAKNAAESADRIKSMFVASMSHELRTPLNSIIGFLGVVLQGMSGTINDMQRDQLNRAYGSARHLLALITDVIDISKIEAGFLQVHEESFLLKPLLLDVEHNTHHISAEKHLQVTINCPEHLMMHTDKKRLYQVVLNVLSNAVKYTERGDVTVTARIKGEMLELEVQDTGIGMDEASLKKLFQPFERAESRLKIKNLGTGLGLYLTNKIVTQLLIGEIRVQSQLEEGSTFTVVIPVKLPKIKRELPASVLEDVK